MMTCLKELKNYVIILIDIVKIFVKKGIKRISKVIKKFISNKQKDLTV